jgi:hypothetical protein
MKGNTLLHQSRTIGRMGCKWDNYFFRKKTINRCFELTFLKVLQDYVNSQTYKKLHTKDTVKFKMLGITGNPVRLTKG